MKNAIACEAANKAEDVGEFIIDLISGGTSTGGGHTTIYPPCRRLEAQITWKCGVNHMKIIRSSKSDVVYHFEMEYNPEFNPSGMYNIATDFTMGELLYKIAARGYFFLQKINYN